MTRSKDKPTEPRPVELSEKALGEIAGGGSSYANKFTCIPSGVSAADANQVAGAVVANPGNRTLKG